MSKRIMQMELKPNRHVVSIVLLLLLGNLCTFTHSFIIPKQLQSIILSSTYQYPRITTRTTINAHGDAVLADDEPLSSRFQRAVVLQRAGEHQSALREYQTFIKAAEQCDVSPRMYAEVHVNVGAIYSKLRDRGEARKNFEIALRYRELGSAHVNLALLVLAEGRMSDDPREGVNALKEAEGHCQKAIELDDDGRCVSGAKKLLNDIEKMLRQSTGSSD